MRTTKVSVQCYLSFVYTSHRNNIIMWAASSEFVSSSIPSWQILTAHAQPFRGARDLAFSLKVPLGSLLVWASSGGSGETARMRRLAWTFAARIGDKYQIRLTRPMLLIKLFRIGPVTGPRSAVLDRGRMPRANTADRGPETRPIRNYLINDNFIN